MNIPMNNVKALYVIFFMLFQVGSNADDIQPVAAVELPCKASKGASAEEETMAVRQVKAQLISKYLESLESSRKVALAPKMNVISGAPDEYLKNFVTRTKDFDKKTKVLTLSAQANVDVAKVNSLLDVAPAAAPGEKSAIVFVFVARRQVQVETKGPKVASSTQTETGTEKEAGVQNRAGESTTSVIVRSGEVVKSGGSVVRTADSINYIVENNAKASIDRTMSKVFVDRGFDTVSASDLVEATKGAFNPDKLEKDFEASSQFSLENQRMATRACREAGAPMLAYGTLTLGMQRPDPVNPRNVIMNVVVDAQVLDCRKALTIKVASIGAMQVEGVGADQTQAENTGLELAASKAAQVLADQLRARGIR